MEERVTLNVGGRTFTTTRETLQKIPHSRLANLRETDSNYDRINREYFFDKDPTIFSCILDTYRSGELHVPACLCGPVVKKELQYWMVSETYIGDCCWNSYNQHDQELKTFKQLEKTLKDHDTGRSSTDSMPGHITTGSRFSCWYSRWKKALWAFLEYPKSSRAAQVWQILMFLLIVTSVAIVVLSTHPTFRVTPDATITATDCVTSDGTDPFNHCNRSINNSDVILNIQDGNFTEGNIFRDTDLHPILDRADFACLLMFTVELVLRFFSCPHKVHFFFSVFNLIDVFCIIPDAVITLLRFIAPGVWEYTESYWILTYLSVTSVLRVFRMLKLASHYRGMRILYLAIKASLRELALLFLLMCMGMFLFSTVIFFAEYEVQSELSDSALEQCPDYVAFDNIPISFWWSIVTMTTVGYGDLVPVTGAGYLIASLCAICGMLATGLPIPIIASNFIHYHKYDRIKRKLKERQKAAKYIEEDSKDSPWKKCLCCFIRPRRIINVQPIREGSAVHYC